MMLLNKLSYGIEMMETINNFIKNYREKYNISDINRFANLIHSHNQSVSSHSYFVSLITMDLCRHYKVSPETQLQCLQWAILHDIPEIYTGDIFTTVKIDHPEFREYLKNLEDAYYRKLGYPIEDDFDLVARYIVKMADNLDVVMFCYIEQELGTKGEYEKIKQRAFNTYLQLKEQVESILFLNNKRGD